MKRIINCFQLFSMIIGFLTIILFIIPLLFGIRPFVVLSSSMEPNINTGSIAYINTKYDVYKIKVGDVIAFYSNNNQVTHRVVKIENGTFITKGDANEVEDIGGIPFGSFIGKTIFSIPYLGIAIQWFKTKIGIFILSVFIGLNILCIIFDSIEFTDDTIKESDDTNEKN